MRKICIIFIFLMFILSCEDFDRTPSDYSLPVGSRIIKVDKNRYEYFQLGERYYCRCYVHAYYFYSFIIFEIDKEIAEKK